MSHNINFDQNDKIMIINGTFEEHYQNEILEILTRIHNDSKLSLQEFNNARTLKNNGGDDRMYDIIIAKFEKMKVLHLDYAAIINKLSIYETKKRDKSKYSNVEIAAILCN